MPSVVARPVKTGKSPVWRKVAPYLYRYVPKGTYYLRGRFGGQPVRECLHTTDFAEAVKRLDGKRDKLKVEQRAARSSAPDTIPSALAEVEALLNADPSLREPTKDHYRFTLARMKPGKPMMPPAGPLSAVSAREIADWWSRVAGVYAPNQANAMLRLVRMAVKRIRKALPFVDDPTAELKRVVRPRTRLELLTTAEFDAVVADLRAMRQGPGKEAADYVEFMAYSGLRPKELRYIEWRDIHQDFNSMEVWGGPDRTKNGDMRPVPIIGRMHALLNRMRAKGGGEGRIFTNAQPRGALKAACQRLGFTHQRIYNLRHLFATACIESGVDVPTAASWLGHKDGGALALRTYVQNRDEHRDRMAAKVTFG